MHTSKDDYLINILRFVSTKKETQIYCSILPESLTSPEMKETKAYKTCLGFATGATPPKKAQKFKKPASPKLSSVPASTKESSGKSKRVKRPAKKTTKALGNYEDDSNNEQESSGEDSDQKNDSDDDKTQSDNENESDSEHETDENESGLESDKKENEDDEEVKEEFVKASSNDFDDEDEIKITDKAEGDEDEEMDYTTSQLYDDVDIRLNELVDTDKEFIQEEVFQFNNRVTTLEKEVAELKKDPLHTQVTALVDDHQDTRLGATRAELMNFLSASLSVRITEQV
ncbi:hypothetical protein Tco_0394868 [Tanacetum coccineum]